MKKKLVAGLLTTVLASTMVCGTAFAAETPEWNTQGGQSTVEGSNTVVEPTIEVELPGSLEFAIDPFYLTNVGTEDSPVATTTQIVSSDYTIVNYSDVAVNVKTETTAVVEGESKVDLSAMATAAVFDTNTKELKPVATKKAVALAMLVPTGATTITDGEPKLATTAISRNGDATADDVKGYVLSATASEVNYILDKYDGESLVAKNASGFRLDGFVDSASTFEEGEITVKTVYTLNVLSEKDKDGWDTAKLDGTKNAGYDATVAVKKQ